MRYGCFNEVIRRKQNSFYEFQGEMLRQLTTVTRWGARLSEQWLHDREPRTRIYRLEIRDPTENDSGLELMPNDENL